MDEATKDESGGRLQQIKAEIAKSARLANRKGPDIHLIAVSKTRKADEIRPLLHSGHRLFGENRVQEAADKWPALRAEFPGVDLHLIGQLQSNKADEAVALFDAIHSLDRISLITALGGAMRRQAKPVPCFIQVNIGAEEQKGGCAIDAVGDLFAAANGEGIPVAGLMCLPPAQVDAAPYFALLAEIAARHDLHQLSMGMSDDFGSAIMLGATHIRIGTALFGPRGA
jgi:pyridoxal phosphate enzyme (YggS family)